MPLYLWLYLWLACSPTRDQTPRRALHSAALPMAADAAAASASSQDVGNSSVIPHPNARSCSVVVTPQTPCLTEWSAYKVPKNGILSLAASMQLIRLVLGALSNRCLSVYGKKSVPWQRSKIVLGMLGKRSVENEQTWGCVCPHTAAQSPRHQIL